MPELKPMRLRRRGIPLVQAVSAAAQKTALGAAAANPVMGLATAEGSPIVGASTNNTASTDKCLFLIPVPDAWAPGAALRIGIRAKTTAVRFVSSSIDIIAKTYGDTLGSDICTTALQSCNSTSFADLMFTIDGTGLQPGYDVLNVEVQAINNDTGGSGAGIIQISKVFLEYEAYTS